MIKIVHYINQFFAQIGGEEMAGHEPEVRVGAVGPGAALNTNFKGEAEITHTIVCGDGYFAENTASALETILGFVEANKPDVFVAGPAFNAGRYGVACGTVAKAVADKFSIPVVTGMYVENPGADMFKNDIYIIPTKDSAAGMRTAAPQMAAFALKLGKGERIGASIEDGFMPNSRRVNFFDKERGSKRAVDMLLAKISGKPFVTEFPMPDFDRVEPAAAIKDLKSARFAIVTSGGIVPKGNPERIESSSASKYGGYEYAPIDAVPGEVYETAHGGYDPVYANQDGYRVLPYDILFDMQKEGKIGSIHNKYYTTTGNGTAVKSSAAFGKEIAEKLLADGVNAVVLTST